MSNAKSELLRSLAARGRSRRVVGVALIAASLTLAGCASAASSAPEVTESEELFSDFVPSAGGEIPDATVPFSMWPYGDTTIGYIGIEEGFFGDVGITLSPEEGQTQLTDVTPGLLLSGELDVVVDYIPTMVQRYEEQPEIQMVQVLNSFIGNYVLAAPDRDATSVEEYVDEGMSFEDATAAVIRDGWFYTGDIGRIDKDGYLSITDRKKELIVTAAGKNVAPQPMEALLKRDPVVAEAVLIGDRRPFISALLVPDLSILIQRLSADASGARLEELVGRDDVRAIFVPIVERANAELANFEQIKTFALLPTEFSVAGGELTPTLKVKRRVVEERWQDAIATLYAQRAARDD